MPCHSTSVPTVLRTVPCLLCRAHLLKSCRAVPFFNRVVPGRAHLLKLCHVMPAHFLIVSCRAIFQSCHAGPGPFT
ncbi:hypothetical protein RHMOL_Rhmol01G0220700 [Rhododendron molle]|uniref:Uncharacterized protein n=1 Tax=Rhododendron molle TaxID=49168 RepID=A0ACC0Q7J8_RHOML|nr:hypothetical protein RHMOL_Rhmol01G0220700 [Rhododendron molle]